MLNILPVSVLLEICKYLNPTDFVKLFILSKQVNSKLSIDLFWTCKYVDDFDMNNQGNLNPKEEYKQKFIQQRREFLNTLPIDTLPVRLFYKIAYYLDGKSLIKIINLNKKMISLYSNNKKINYLIVFKIL